MTKKLLIKISCILTLLIIAVTLFSVNMKEKSLKENSIEGTIISKTNKKITIQDDKNIIYTFNDENAELNIGDNILIKYTGIIDKSTEYQDIKVISYKVLRTSQDETDIEIKLYEDGIFKDYYTLAKTKLETLTLDEKIGQLFLVRYPDTNAIEDLKKYYLGGFVFFEKDFKDKSTQEVQNMINELQNAANIPLLTAVDEEGGKVTRISTNKQLVSEPFKSPQELYKLGGFDEIRKDTIEKSKILNNLGLNLNLAPVVDIAEEGDYIYERTLGQNTELTKTYAETVIEASKGTGVSYTLKHFPGYGGNEDTHTGITKDDRTYDELEEIDLPPFQAGIDKNAEAILVSHNILTNIDPANPASLSASIHNLLRNNMNFTGIIMTDDLSMAAVSSIDNAVTKAILAGNDIIIITDYKEGIESVKNAIENNIISEEQIDTIALRILAWKYYKGIMTTQK